MKMHVYLILMLGIIMCSCSRVDNDQAISTIAKADSADMLGILYSDTAALQQAINTLEAHSWRHRELLAKAYYYSARNQSINKHEVRAMRDYLKATDYNNDEQNLLQGRIYSNIAYTCGLARKNDLAIEYFGKAGSCYRAIGDTVRYVGNDLELARIYNRDSSTYHIADSLLLYAAQMHIDSFLMGRIMDTRTIVNNERKDYYTALIYAQRAITYPAKSNETELLPYRHRILMQLYANIGLTDSVTAHAQYVISHSQNPNYLKAAYQQLASISQENKELQDALAYYKGRVSNTEESSLWKGEQQEAVTILQNYEKAAKNNTVAAIIGTIIVILMTGTLVFAMVKRRKEMQLNNEIHNLQQQLREASRDIEHREHEREVIIMQLVNYFNASHPDYCKTAEWKDDNKFRNTINYHFANLIDRLEAHSLSITEQRLSVLVLLGMSSNNDIATYCYIAPSSVSKTKARAAAKINSTAAQLQSALLNMIR